MFELADIRRLLDAFEEEDWDEIRLLTDGYEIHIATHDPGDAAVAASAPTEATEVSHRVAAAGGGTGPESAESADRDDGAASPGVTQATSDPGAVVETGDLHEVISPSPGIFYHAPGPGLPPFVEVGQRVSADTPVGIVEVMKLMNHVLAGVEGTVRSIAADNAVSVERGQPLVLIEPDS